MARYPKGKCANIIRPGRKSICDNCSTYTVGCPDCLARRRKYKKKDSWADRWKGKPKQAYLDYLERRRAYQRERYWKNRPPKKPLEEKVFKDHASLREELNC